MIFAFGVEQPSTRWVTHMLPLVVIEAREYVDERGRSPYRDWLVKLDTATRVRIITAVLRLEQGNVSAVRGLSTGLSEVSLNFGPGYRIYFGWAGEQLVILLGGGSKRRQQADIEAAQALWAEYRARGESNQ